MKKTEKNNKKKIIEKHNKKHEQRIIKTDTAK